MASFEVEPASLREGSKQFASASDTIGTAAGTVDSVRLADGALGEVAAAAEFTRALSGFTSLHARDLKAGAGWVADTGTGLAENAEAYERQDGDSADKLDAIWGTG
ncbi:type VII secretion target [Goodfellowiella coeruleoviolacea]|uniref:Excreted virulence factor EspC, type VII ESX diderm n=1 Tax=Goodfellowiella coeruleoviolacea TaxID=334858 RepID=A0AAE3KF89_9PSEU|nr:type VII secretion target [Goodfellowiella coeruleoviolacea]MCP2166131.1 Excreted virulence factor EspC, type VII ESX diderm [Goodfellowiella coeruleoviolacea]